MVSQPREVRLVNRKGLEENGKSMQMKHEEEEKKKDFSSFPLSIPRTPLLI